MSKMDAEQNTVLLSPNKKLTEEFIQLLRETLIKDLERSNAKLSTGQVRNKGDPLDERLSEVRRNNGASLGRDTPAQWLGSSLKTGKEFENFSSSQKENEFLTSTKSDSALAVSVQVRKKKSRFKKVTAMIGHFLHRNEKKRRKKSDAGDDSLALNGQSRKGSENLSIGRLFKTSERRESNDSRKRESRSIFRSFRRSRSAKRDSDAKPATEAEVYDKDSDENIISLPATILSQKDIASDTSKGPYKSTEQSVSFEVSDAHEGSFSRFISSSPVDTKLDHGDHRGASASIMHYTSRLATARSSTPTNALDDPGEDIDYMDLEPPDGTSLDENARKAYSFTPRRQSMSSFLDSQGIKNLQLLAQAQMESTSEGNIFSNSEVRQNALGGASSEVTHKQKSLDEIYDMFAKKLAEMADPYSRNVSDRLKEFKEEIIACSRTTGEPISEAIDTLNNLVLAEMHWKYKTSSHGSLSSEFVLYPLKLVYYTTKAAVSFVGIGTETATKMIEYISDTMITWFCQGGFDSIMSSRSESDLDVD